MYNMYNSERLYGTMVDMSSALLTVVWTDLLFDNYVVHGTCLHDCRVCTCAYMHMYDLYVNVELHGAWGIRVERVVNTSP